MRKPPKKLVVEFDVSSLSKDQIDDLAGEATAQGEESDGQGGKRYSGVPGRPGHPSVQVIGTKTTRDGRLAVEFDVTGLSKDQINWLAAEVLVQGESSEGHPAVAGSHRVTAGNPDLPSAR